MGRLGVRNRAIIEVIYAAGIRRIELVNINIRDVDFQRQILTEAGQRMKPHKVTDMVTKCVNRSGIDKKGACHLLRHATATEMLRHGADTREVEEMLGHSDISSTQIYAHVTINDLNRVYYETHPATVSSVRDG